ncbi:MAG: type II secretion system F family protein [Candidatus Omnitrophota bacterium]
MAKFTYFARNENGEKVKGTLDSASLNTLVAALKKQRMVVLSAREIKPKIRIQMKMAGTGKIRLSEISFFFRQLATMVGAGVSITDSLRELASQIKNVNFSGIVNGMRTDIEKGNSFSQTLAKHPRLFPSIITAMIKSGEEGGNLSAVLEQISVHLEDKIALQREVKTATTYPAFILGFFIFALCFIVLFLIPKFTELFASFDVVLPPLTRFVMDTSNIIIKNFIWLVLIFFAVAVTCYRYNRTRNGRRFFDRRKLRLPVLGETFRLIALSYFCQTFAALISSGVPVIKCLGIVGTVSGNSLIEDASDKIKNGVESGGTISAEMRKEPIFPPLLTRMVSVGEETGKLSEMFSRINRFYRDEAMARTKMLTTTLEPAMLLGLGVIVGFVVIALYLPIFKLSGSVNM